MGYELSEKVYAKMILLGHMVKSLNFYLQPKMIFLNL